MTNGSSQIVTSPAPRSKPPSSSPPPASQRPRGPPTTTFSLPPFLSPPLSIQQANWRDGERFSHYSNGMEITYLAFLFDMEPLISHWLPVPGVSWALQPPTPTPFPSISIPTRDPRLQEREGRAGCPERAPGAGRRAWSGLCSSSQLSSGLGLQWGRSQTGRQSWGRGALAPSRSPSSPFRGSPLGHLTLAPAPPHSEGSAHYSLGHAQGGPLS